LGDGRVYFGLIASICFVGVEMFVVNGIGDGGGTVISCIRLILLLPGLGSNEGINALN
jgi:hypothetical protein